MSFEKNLNLIRKRNGMTQEDLALTIGVSRQTIYAWEAGLNSPNISMLKKVASALEVSIDELINGYDVDRLPNLLGEIVFSNESEYYEDVIYEEIPNWYVSLKVGEDVCFGLYDNGVKDYSYHVTVLGEIIVHNQKGYEIGVKEYDNKLEQTDAFSLIAKRVENRIVFIGRIYYKDGIKNIETFRDKSFLNKWGTDGKFEGPPIIFQEAKKYAMTYNGKTESVIRIAYFDANNSYIEVFLNLKGESLFWKRYELGRKSGTILKINDKEYGLFYEVATSRLIR